MNNAYIALLDSGIGGLSVLNEFIKRLPGENFLYYGDGDNAPYGNRTVRDLTSIALDRVNEMNAYPLKAIVLACNTLSVNVRNYISGYAGVPVFGVFPPVERYVGEDKPTLLLATERTAENYRGLKNVHAVGMKSLARDIEYNMFNVDNVDFEKNLARSVGYFREEKGYYDTVILGCTHYVFIKNKILDHFCPKKIVDGATFTVKSVQKYLVDNKSLVKNKRFSIKFIGRNAEVYKKFCVSGGQKGKN